MYCEGSGKFSKLKNSFLQESLLLQPIIILNNLLVQLEKSLYCLRSAPRTISCRSLQSGSRNSKSFSEYLVLLVV